MSINLRIFLLLLLFLQMLLVINTIKKRNLSMKFGSFWILIIFLMSIVVIYPKILFDISVVFGFELMSNMIFIIGFFFLFCVIFILTTSISIQNNKIKKLIQEVSLLKEVIDKKER